MHKATESELLKALAITLDDYNYTVKKLGDVARDTGASLHDVAVSMNKMVQAGIPLPPHHVMCRSILAPPISELSIINARLMDSRPSCPKCHRPQSSITDAHTEYICYCGWSGVDFIEIRSKY